MRTILTLAIGDLRQILRDPTLKFFLIIPFFLIAFIRYFVPYITIEYPVMAEYHVQIMMFTGIQSSVMFGFITSFLLLEEKDQNLLQVLRVLPITPGYFITYRLLFATIMSFLLALITINLTGVAYPGFENSVLLSIQYGLAAPLITLIVATYAKNKVEGMAYFKAVDFFLIIPLLAFFILSIPKFIFMALPTYWTFTLYEVGFNKENVTLAFLIGTMVYLMAISGLYFQFNRKVFDR